MGEKLNITEKSQIPLAFFLFYEYFVLQSDFYKL